MAPWTWNGRQNHIIYTFFDYLVPKTRILPQKCPKVITIRERSTCMSHKKYAMLNFKCTYIEKYIPKSYMWNCGMLAIIFMLYVR